MSSIPAKSNPWTPGRYPVARRSDHIDVYQSAAKGKVQVHDPYQWLETNSDETKTWIQGGYHAILLKFGINSIPFAAQVDLTDEYLKQCTDRAKLKELMMQNVDFPKVRPSEMGSVACKMTRYMLVFCPCTQGR
jgi:prolyl oligopeptidase